MFTPLNKETSKKRFRAIVKERKFIKETYYQYLLNLNKLDEIYEIKNVYEENNELLNQIKEFSLYNYLLKKGDLDIQKYNIFNYKKVLFLYIENQIDKKEYIKSKKLLNICKEKNFTNNEYWQLLEKINKFY